MGTDTVVDVLIGIACSVLTFSSYPGVLADEIELPVVMRLLTRTAEKGPMGTSRRRLCALGDLVLGKIWRVSEPPICKRQNGEDSGTSNDLPLFAAFVTSRAFQHGEGDPR